MPPARRDRRAASRLSCSIFISRWSIAISTGGWLLLMDCVGALADAAGIALFASYQYIAVAVAWDGEICSALCIHSTESSAFRRNELGELCKLLLEVRYARLRVRCRLIFLFLRFLCFERPFLHPLPLDE